MEAKKLLTLRILQILEEYSDCDHTLSQQQIINYLERQYGLQCERKAVGRNISFLREAGYEIESDGRGVWLAERRFEKSEIQLLIDSVIAYRFVDAGNTKRLVEKLKREGGRYFRPHLRSMINTDEWQKSANKELFLTIEILDEAIATGRKVEFFYNTYTYDKKLKKRKESKYKISPYHLVLKNQRYYVVANLDGHDDVRFFRLDFITGATLTDDLSRSSNELAGHESGFKLSETVNKLPYMYFEKPVRVIFIAKESILSDIVDWFGFDFRVERMGTNTLQGEGAEIQVTLNTSPAAMRYWLLQYGASVCVRSPESLVEVLRRDIQNMSKNYKL